MGLQGPYMLAVGRTDCAVEFLCCREFTEHPGKQRSPRQLIGPLLGMPASAVRLVTP